MKKREAESGIGRTVVVCTCRAPAWEWIRSRRLYNLPLPKDGKGESYAPVTHIAVYALDLPDARLPLPGCDKGARDRAFGG